MKMPQGLAAMCAFVVVCAAAPDAVAQKYVRMAAIGERLTEQQAIAVLDTYLSGHPRGIFAFNCGGFFSAESRIEGYQISSTSLRITLCKGKKSVELRFVDVPVVAQQGKQLCIGTVAGIAAYQEFCNGEAFFLDVKDFQAFANAWLALAHPPPKDPATDEAFLAALKAASGAGDRTEDQRRTQVQVEALVGVGKKKEAAALYRDALKTSPDWASGHYNLALIAADLGDLTEAITEMRRYLYLEPGAQDARAAQDQIYKWEALLTAKPPQ